MFATDWVQLWALNPDIMEPDYEVGKSAATILKTGETKIHTSFARIPACWLRICTYARAAEPS
jgi:hypothetical protein